jgi:hypothetical protein
MPKIWLALSATKEALIVVHAEVPDDDDAPIIIKSDSTWRVQQGDRATAYGVLHQQCSDYIQEHQVSSVFVKASAVMGRGPATMGLLLSAEVRGVVLAAAGALCHVRAIQKATISRTFGTQKVDDYVADDTFWAKQTTGGKLRRMSREACMLLVAARNG